jgi:uncharacterized Fe-S center protein
MSSAKREKPGAGKRSEVYFAAAAAKGSSLVAKIRTLFGRAGFRDRVPEDGLVAVKMHFGERENANVIRPLYVRTVVDEVRAAGGKPFLTDTNTLYVGGRSNAVDHLDTAARNGYHAGTVGAPVIIGDGLWGKSAVKIPFPGDEYDEISLGAEICNADAMVCLTHVTGHGLFGLGGTIKNLGMGSGSRAGKQMMHAKVRPKVKTEICDGCRRCARWCPADAIGFEESSGGRPKARIYLEKCIGCGECVATCQNEAIEIDWGDAAGAQRRTADVCAALIGDRPERFAYFAFLLGVTADCDCFGNPGPAIVPDIGVLASTDPVAIDQASVDLLTGATALPGTRVPKAALGPGKDKLKAIFPSVDWTAQLRQSVELGLGSRKYELLEV